MGDRDVNINISAQDKASTVFERVKRSFTGLAGHIGTEGKGGRPLGNALGGAFGVGGDSLTKSLAVLGGIRLASSALGVITEGIKHGWDGVSGALERLPLGFGELVRLGREWNELLTGSTESMDKLVAAASGKLPAVFAASISGPQKLSDMAQSLREQAALTGQTGTGRAALDAQFTFRRNVAAIEAAQTEANARAAQARSKVFAEAGENGDTVQSRLGELRMKIVELEQKARDLDQRARNNPSEGIVAAQRDVDLALAKSQDDASRLQRIVTSANAAADAASEGADFFAKDALNAAASLRDRQINAAKEERKVKQSPDLIARDASLLQIAPGKTTRADEAAASLKQQVKLSDETVRTLRDILTEIRNQQPGGLSAAPGI